MPVRSDKGDMQRYASAGSLSMPRDMKLSTASHDSNYSDDKMDLYRSSPDLSQGSHAHTRSSSTDSAEGGYYGNHSRQSSGSTDYPTRRLSTSGRKISTSTLDPLQFVKVGGAQSLAEQAKKQIEVAKEVNQMRGKVDLNTTDEKDWQSNFDSWKSRRKSTTHSKIIDDVPLEEEAEEPKKTKTFSQIMAEKASREASGGRSLYHHDDNDSGIGVKTNTKPTSKSTVTDSQFKDKKSKKADVAPWAQDSSEENSQSDSETNNSHQSGDTDSVFSDKSTPSKVLSDDDSWVKKNQIPTIVAAKVTPVHTQKPASDNMTKLWQNNVNESQNKDNNVRKVKDIPIGGSPKFKDIAKSFEQKDQDAKAEPVVVRRSEYGKMDNVKNSPFRRSVDLPDSRSPRYSAAEKKPLSPLAPNSPSALLPRDQRYHSPGRVEEPASQDNDKTYVEKTIKISQSPNNDRGFGFTLMGGIERRQPITVQRVALGSAADVQEVETNDQLLAVNGRDVSILTLVQVQGIVDHAVKKGQIELKVKRLVEHESYDSMEEEEEESLGQFNNNNNSNRKIDVQSDSSMSVEPSSIEETSFSQITVKTDETGKPRFMDQLIGERQRENNKMEKNNRAPSPVSVEPPVQVNISLATESLPPPPPLPRDIAASHDVSAPRDIGIVDQTLTEERPTLSITRTPVRAPVVHSSPSPPSPPKAAPPPLVRSTDMNSSDDSSGFGPPVGLMRWQKPRAKSEFQRPALEDLEKERKLEKRMSSTLPYNTAANFSFDANASSKDDTAMNKVNKDFTETITISKPTESKPRPFQFNDTSRITEWQMQQEQMRAPGAKPYQPIELHITREETLTAQSAAPARKVAQIEVPDLGQINAPNFEVPLSPQEKFERDQQRIRLQYEEEKKKAKDTEKQKQQQEKQVLNADKFMQSMESQILQTKQEATNQSPANNEPTLITTNQNAANNEARYTSEPMTIRLPNNSGRRLMIDPRNQADSGENALPEYSFRVELSQQQESAPPLRTLNTTQELSMDQLEAEREKIRQEEKRKLEQEKQRWIEEQERDKLQQEQQLREKEENLRRERERLQREAEEVERERARLQQQKAQDDLVSHRYQSVTNTSLYLHSKSPSGGSPGSLSPIGRSQPRALDPKHHESLRKVPPPTAPKPDKNAKDKARLTREDLLAMNRKAKPLTKPDHVESSSPSDSVSPTVREAPTKGELHSLNAVPKQRVRSSKEWIKQEDPMTNNTQDEKPFVIGKRSDLIHQRDYSNPNDHWLVREAEKRRIEEARARDNIVESVTARAGPAIPSQSSLVNRFRSDREPPPRANRFSYPSSQFGDLPSSTSAVNLGREKGITTQFTAQSQPNNLASNTSLSQTLPPNLSFNARNHDTNSGAKPPRPLSESNENIVAVSGKQKCSHCGEELGFGAAMVIESLGLYYHVQCFHCCVCRTQLGNGSEGADVRVRVDKLHCKNCYSNDEAGLKFSKV